MKLGDKQRRVRRRVVELLRERTAVALGNLPGLRHGADRSRPTAPSDRTNARSAAAAGRMDTDITGRPAFALGRPQGLESATSWKGRFVLTRSEWQCESTGPVTPYTPHDSVLPARSKVTDHATVRISTRRIVADNHHRARGDFLGGDFLRGDAIGSSASASSTLARFRHLSVPMSTSLVARTIHAGRRRYLRR